MKYTSLFSLSLVAALFSTTPAFADPAPEMALSDQLAEAAAAPWQKVLGQVQALVEAAPDLPTLQKTLLAAFGDLDTARLVEIMQAGFALAELRGMVDARDG